MAIHATPAPRPSFHSADEDVIALVGQSYDANTGLEVAVADLGEDYGKAQRALYAAGRSLGVKVSVKSNKKNPALLWFEAVPLPVKDDQDQ